MKLLLFVVAVASLAGAQSGPADTSRPPLFFREDFKETPPATPITQEHLSNPNLILALYGPGKDGMKKSHHPKPADDPYYIWDGTCPANCAASLRDKDSYVDLTGLAKIRWRTKQSGYRQLHILLKLGDGTWLVSGQADGPSSDWREREFNIADLRWHRLDIEKIVEAAWIDHPDLRRVDEIGWTDLMVGGGTPASSRLDWIEVYGKPVRRIRAVSVRRPGGGGLE
ncbi:MAG TPA: hypothetical protein VKV15_06815 [Bryobacteraceae bacterium]|nr:hypothetical protein [Bryobacteraceae bacterium]